MIEDQAYQVKRLSREEFAAALRKGQGRALLHVLHYGLDEFADLVLETCLHNQVYDQQLESRRGDWLYSMFQGSVYVSEFRAEVLKALQTDTNQDNLYQLWELAKKLARQGDKEVRQGLREVVFRFASDPKVEWPT
jgi:hypothetical protein